MVVVTGQTSHPLASPSALLAQSKQQPSPPSSALFNNNCEKLMKAEPQSEPPEVPGINNEPQGGDDVSQFEGYNQYDDYDQYEGYNPEESYNQEQYSQNCSL